MQKTFNDMDLNDYKQIIAKIDKKLKNKLDEETIIKLKDANSTISSNIYPGNEENEDIKKEEFDENEKEKLYEEYNNIKNLII